MLLGWVQEAKGAVTSKPKMPEQEEMWGSQYVPGDQQECVLLSGEWLDEQKALEKCHKWVWRLQRFVEECLSCIFSLWIRIPLSEPGQALGTQRNVLNTTEGK